MLHARISIGDTDLMGADIPNAEPMRSAYLSLGVDSDAEADRIFSSPFGWWPGFHAHAGDVLRHSIRSIA